MPVLGNDTKRYRWFIGQTLKRTREWVKEYASLANEAKGSSPSEYERLSGLADGYRYIAERLTDEAENLATSVETEDVLTRIIGYAEEAGRLEQANDPQARFSKELTRMIANALSLSTTHFA